MNYILAGAMAGKSVGKQISIATSYQALVSGNNPNGSPNEMITDILVKGSSVSSSFVATKAFHQVGIGKVGQVFFSELIGNYVGNYNASTPHNEKSEEK